MLEVKQGVCMDETKDRKNVGFPRLKSMLQEVLGMLIPQARSSEGGGLADLARLEVPGLSKNRQTRAVQVAPSPRRPHARRHFEVANGLTNDYNTARMARTREKTTAGQKKGTQNWEARRFEEKEAVDHAYPLMISWRRRL
jgi:hypothetical protein